VLDGVDTVDAQVGERVVAVSAAEQVRVAGGRQSTAARPVGRHRQVRSCGAHVRELVVETLGAVVHPDTAIASCTPRPTQSKTANFAPLPQSSLCRMCRVKHDAVGFLISIYRGVYAI